jgi:hypothetical protein
LQWVLAQEDVRQEEIDLMHQAIVAYRTHGSRTGLVCCNVFRAVSSAEAYAE